MPRILKPRYNPTDLERELARFKGTAAEAQVFITHKYTWLHIFKAMFFEIQEGFEPSDGENIVWVVPIQGNIRVSVWILDREFLIPQVESPEQLSGLLAHIHRVLSDQIMKNDFTIIYDLEESKIYWKDRRTGKLKFPDSGL